MSSSTAILVARRSRGPSDNRSAVPLSILRAATSRDFKTSSRRWAASGSACSKEIAPNVKRVGILFSAAPHTSFFLRAAEKFAPSLNVSVAVVDIQHELEGPITKYAEEPDSGLIVLPHPRTIANRGLINSLAVRHRLPAIYPYRYFSADGGLIAYGPDQIDQWRGAAGYVDRILKGEKPADLPVQAPTKYELVINLKTAKSLGLTVPPALLARADEVIE